jgi:transcriptional regulator with XRE-family HTH domain
VDVAEKSQKLCQAVAEILRERRLAADLSLNRLSEISGISRQMIGYIEQGRNLPTIESFSRIAISLRCDPAEIFRTALDRISKEEQDRK